MSSNLGALKPKWGLGVLVIGVMIAVAACFPQPTPPKSTTTTTQAPTTTTTLAPTTTTTTLAPTTTTTTLPAPVCTPGSNNIAPNPLSTTATSVSLCYTGQTANQRLFINQCNAPVDAVGFDPFNNCSNLSELTVNPSDNPGAGSLDYPIFYGPEPTGDVGWGCFKAGDTPPPGITAYTTCYIRITNGSQTNLTDQKSIPFTFSS